MATSYADLARLLQAAHEELLEHTGYATDRLRTLRDLITAALAGADAARPVMPVDARVETFSNVAGWSSRTQIFGDSFEWGNGPVGAKAAPRAPWYRVNGAACDLDEFERRVAEAQAQHERDQARRLERVLRPASTSGTN